MQNIIGGGLAGVPTNELTLTELRPLLAYCIKEKITLIIEGQSGIGKSDTVHQVTAELGLDMIDTLRLSQMEPVDMRGGPVIKDGRFTFSEPHWWPRDPDWKGVVFLDEAGQSNDSMQAAAMQLVLELRSGEHKLPPGAAVIAATNLVDGHAGVRRMLAPLSRRFTWIRAISDVPGWCKWALSIGGIEPVIVALIRFRPSLLFDFDKTRTVDPNPRAWARVSKLISAPLPPKVRFASIVGTVGPGPAVEVETFLRTYEQLPNIDHVLMHPDTAEVPRDPSVMFALAGALAARADRRNFQAVLTYGRRLGEELLVFIAQDATARDSSIANTAAFTKFAVDFQEVLL